MLNVVIEYRISLLKIDFRMSQRFRVDGDTFENAPHVDADLFRRMKKAHFQKDQDTRGRGLNVQNVIPPFFQLN